MSEDSLLGAQLDEYRLEVMLGRGGMARVYRALDTGLNRYVAVKVIDAPHRSDAEYTRRFKIEAQAIARLDHPHVVRLFRYGEVDGMLYMALQFIEGADLGFLLASYRQDGEYIPSRDALRLVDEIAQALDYIHAHGVIHRDVKPNNIMLTRSEGRVVLTDFGLALRPELGTRGKVFGSPHYVAPEQAVSSARAVPQSDLYSLGVILYEMFSGALPFDAPDPMDIAVMQMSSPPPPPHTFRPDLNREVEAVILKALEKKPADRYQSGRELTLALARALRKQPVVVLPTSLTIPERVTLGFSANPLAALPPIPGEPSTAGQAQPTPAPQTAAMIPPTGELPLTTAPPEQAGQSHSEPGRAIPPGSPPRGAAKKTSPWLLGIAALAGVCVLACLGIVGLSILLSGRMPLAGITPKTPLPSASVLSTATILAQKTPSPIPQATLTSAVLEDYRLKFWRCEDEVCLVVENTGKVAFPLADLTLKAKDSSFSGEVWGVASLQPGQCVKLVSDDKWAGQMPGGAACQVTGPAILRKGKDRFWSSGFTIYFQDQKAAECPNKGAWCEVLVRR